KAENNKICLPSLSSPPIPPLRHFARPAPPAFWTLRERLVDTWGRACFVQFLDTRGQAYPPLRRHSPHISLTFHHTHPSSPATTPSAFRHYAAHPIIFFAFYAPFQLF